MTPKLTETIYVDFITSSPTTGAATDADSLPVCEVFEDATDTAVLSPTVVKRTGKTGNYRVPIVCTAANGFEASKTYNAVVSATVGAVAAKAIIRTFQVRTTCVDDPVTLTSAYDAAKTAATQASVTTLAGYVDTEVASILAAVDTEIASILTKVNALPADPADASDIAASFSAISATLATLSGYVDTEVAAILAAVDTEVAAIKAVTDKTNTMLVADAAVYQYTANALELGPAGGGGGGDASQATLLAVKAKTDALPSDPADASDIAASFTGVNTKLDVIDDFLDTEIGAIKAKTDQLVFSGGRVDANATLSLVAGDITAIADGILKRDWTSVSGEALYSLLNAARMLRNVWSTTSGILTVKKEDGTTTAWQRTLVVDPTAQPIVGAS